MDEDKFRGFIYGVNMKMKLLTSLQIIYFMQKIKEQEEKIKEYRKHHI